MALDPLTALSVAGTIVQFVDFSTKVLSRTNRLYKSAQGTLDAQEELTLVISDLVKIANQIPRPLPGSGNHLATEDEDALHTLCKICSDMADELLTRLNELKVPAGNKHRIWKSFYEALKSVWKEEDMKSIVKRLSAVREEIQMRVILGLRVQLDSLSLQKSKRFDALDKATQSILTALLNIPPDVAESITELKDCMQNQTLAITQLLGRVDCVAVKQNFAMGTAVMGGSPNVESSIQADQIGGDKVKETHVSKIDDSLETQIRREAAAEVIRDLHYPTITAREEQIAEAHKATFQWILRNASDSDLPWDGFTDWLKDGSGIYWVNGKAASGKSTLMRYLYGHPITNQLLNEWAKPLPLTTGRFFFWNSGTHIQRSQVGLLRSLLFECLTQNPTLVPIVLPLDWARNYSELALPFEDTPYIVDWDKVKTLDEVLHSYLKTASKVAKPRSWAWVQQRKPDLTASQRDRLNNAEAQTTVADRWSLAYLKEAFDNLIKQDSVAIKICLFVDGLDEYDGDHSMIASLFQKISSSPHVKVCVASRPLLPFDDAFKATRSLRLQDLTRQDIKLYVTSSLNNNVYFQHFAREEPSRAYFLINDIVSKANGVFLWVTLVVESLLEGLGNRDDIFDLQRRIDLLPPDLETLFDSMLAKVSEFYLMKTSQLFQLVRSSREYLQDVGPHRDTAVTLDLITLSLADDPDHNQAITAEFKDISEDDIGKRCGRMEDRLKVLSMGLLEAVKDGCKGIHRGSQMCGQVQYLHRTVRDYLEGSKVWPTLLQRTQGSDFNPNTSLLRAFVWRLKLNIELMRGTEPIAMAAIIHAYHADIETQQSNTALLVQLNRARERYWSLYLSMETYHRDFTILAVQYALCSYINESFNYGSVREHYEHFPLLDWALIPARQNERCPLSSRMVTILLQLGADPNEKLVGGITVWTRLLKHVWDLSRSLKTQESGKVATSELLTYAKILKVLLEHGADAKAKVHGPHPYGTKPARWVVQNVFGSLYPVEAALLDGMFNARGAKLKKASFYRRAT